MAPIRRTTRSTPARDTTRNGDDSHTSGTGVRRNERAVREMFPEETDKIERYVGGMPDLIYSSVVASKPKTMQEAIEMATELMDRRINTFAESQAENKRKFEVTRPGSLFRCDPFWGCYIIDEPWFSKRKFVEYFYHDGLGHVPRLTRVEWGVIRR
ncbi:reverse transcriptase domain-containing protein [Tanacetum coccineum]